MKLAFAAILATCALAGPAIAQTPNPPTEAIPVAGVDQIFAMEGDNTLLAYATPSGYAALNSLVKHLDGQLEIIRTDVSYVEVTSGNLKTLGITPADSGKLLTAFVAGKLTATDHVRLTTREDTPIETLLRTRSKTQLSLSLVPREQPGGAPTVELLQPDAKFESLVDNATLLARLPTGADGTIRLLFLTPTILPNNTRR